MALRIISKIKSFFQTVAAKVSGFIDTHIEQAALFVFQHKKLVFAVDVALSAVAFALGKGSWAMWAHILLLQNWAFTYVSRARNSASLTRHLRAGFLSNFVWWISQVIIFTKLFNYIKGDHGTEAALLTGVYYTIFTLTGSILAHAQSLITEKGKAAVGASAKYAQIPVAEWAETQKQLAVLKTFLAQYSPEYIDNIKRMAEEAHTMSCGALPVSKVQAVKIEGETVIAGLPGDINPNDFIKR